MAWCGDRLHGVRQGRRSLAADCVRLHAAPDDAYGRGSGRNSSSSSSSGRVPGRRRSSSPCCNARCQRWYSTHVRRRWSHLFGHGQGHKLRQQQHKRRLWCFGPPHRTRGHTTDPDGDTSRTCTCAQEVPKRRISCRFRVLVHTNHGSTRLRHSLHCAPPSARRGRDHTLLLPSHRRRPPVGPAPPRRCLRRRRLAAVVALLLPRQRHLPPPLPGRL